MDEFVFWVRLYALDHPFVHKLVSIDRRPEICVFFFSLVFLSLSLFSFVLDKKFLWMTNLYSPRSTSSMVGSNSFSSSVGKKL